ncbi:hypothetical protein ERO13_A05G238850v2 [Gossypium hirsutum]|uniref:Uncharacterized protein n=2 Tax=Gossypium TaxID=3633 RepID=A0A5J5VTP7_GOSBA|nr:hypothetical protein ES319_A05G247100v1 [Gossypium barbadense]KAG4200837.1 hypothetical protein ERO13_A05G238850v2 [Gossypium hirsutum]TYH18239.1 hypothetical protein ES288_A05G254100v1 [Gossypium darwinii]
MRICNTNIPSIKPHTSSGMHEEDPPHPLPFPQYVAGTFGATTDITWTVVVLIDDD